jgi:hypothetical protein
MEIFANKKMRIVEDMTPWGGNNVLVATILFESL